MNRTKDLETTRQETAATKARIAQICTWFDVAPPKMQICRKGVTLSNDLVQWASSNGVSLDWLFLGDVQGMAVAFRQKHAAVAA
jgi:hypothetical protein